MSITKFPLNQQWGHVGSELGRAISRKNQNDVESYSNSLKRALNMLSEMIDDHQQKNHNLKEITRFREFLAGIYTQSGEVVSLHELESYCNHFVLPPTQ